MTPAASPTHAVELLAGRVRAVGTARVPLEVAVGRVLAERVVADRPSPAMDVSAMDGYAVRLVEVRAGTMRVAAEARVGREAPAFEAGAAVKIVTGAPVPPGADAVIKREDVDERGETIGVSEAAATAFKTGQNIRRRGENLAAGATVIEAGVEVAAPVMGALATFGVGHVLVHRRVRVATLVTGDEVLGVGEAVADWQLRDSNGPALRAMLGAKSWVELLPARRCPDEPGMLREAAQDLLACADLLLLTGGVSMGDRDFVPGVLRGLGAEVLFHKVPQRPGQPVLGAVGAGGQAILGLPGNPLSVMVTARRMSAPIAQRLAGVVGVAPPMRVALNDDGKRIELWWHRLVRLVEPGRAELVDSRGSGDIPSAARSDGFVEIPPGEGGSQRDLYPWTI